ncbi:hypothetical protein U4960_14590 [Altererythrobacter sp. H2]|uniref:hypothetical protein n=1 Tax=Altererythrobacter sp. H2 TaxID=3108391 RepID=UPI000BC777C3|nr:hypothetical protein [Altererythrobacter sp. H2]OZA94532.1 MAG: hypothetical protein B7X57_01100 [Erythrobacter sp. 34-65-8]WRK95490.1 hypothetical protein U4960_14590 [Altererythrobacter sp. H2]
MSASELVPILGLVTLIIALIAAAIALTKFLRKPSNRHPMDHREERNVAADIDAGRAPKNHSPRR